MRKLKEWEKKEIIEAIWTWIFVVVFFVAGWYIGDEAMRVWGLEDWVPTLGAVIFGFIALLVRVIREKIKSRNHLK